MWPMIIRGGLSVARSALLVLRGKRTGDALISMLSPEEIRTLSVQEEVQEEEIYFLIFVLSVHDYMSNQQRDLAGKQDVFLDAALETVDGNVYLAAASDANNKVNAFISGYALYLSENHPDLRPAFAKMADLEKQSGPEGGIARDVIRAALTNKDKKANFINLIMKKGYAEEDIKVICDNLVDDTTYDKANTDKVNHGYSFFIAILSAYDFSNREIHATVGNISFNSGYLPSFTLRPHFHQTGAKRLYQTKSLTMKFINEVGAVFDGTYRKTPPETKKDKAGKAGTGAGTLAEDVVTTAALASFQNSLDKEMAKVKSRGAAYARKKYGRDASKMFTKIMQTVALRNLTKR